MLDAQRNTHFKGNQYGRLRKVVSIWICPNCPESLAGSVRLYNINELIKKGDLTKHRNKGDYDMMEIAMIYLGKEPPPEKPSCEHLLQTLFTEKLSIDERL